MQLKLDLHVHFHEAMGFVPLTIPMVTELVAVLRERGLNGVAITDHYGYDTNIAYRVKEIVDRDFNGEFIIIPGQEVDVGLEHVVELFLPHNRIFRFLAHPTTLLIEDEISSNIQGIEVKNGQYGIDEIEVKEFARENNLLLLCNSDAHSLKRVGVYYNEIDLNELMERSLARSS